MAPGGHTAAKQRSGVCDEGVDTGSGLRLISHQQALRRRSSSPIRGAAGVESEERRRSRRGAEGAAQQLQEALLPEGLPPRQGMVHTPSRCRCEAATVDAPASVPALLQGRSSDRCGHRSVGGRRPFQQPHRCRSRSRNSTVAEQLTQCRGGMDPHRQDSRRRGPPASVPGSCQSGPRARNSGVQLSAFLQLRTGELVHPVGESTACPGTGTGHSAASQSAVLHCINGIRATSSLSHQHSPQRGWVAAVI